MTAKLNLSLREGATFRRRLRWFDVKSKPINLTGVAVSAQFRNKADGQLLLELTPANGRLIVKPLLGQISIELSAADTAAMAYAKAVWDLKLVFPNGDVTYLLEGAVNVTRSVTT